MTNGDVGHWVQYYEAYWNFVGTLVDNEFWPPFDFEKLRVGPAVCGSPEALTERIGQWREMLSLDRHLFMFDLGGMDPAHVTETVELFGTEVLPSFR